MRGTLEGGDGECNPAKDSDKAQDCLAFHSLGFG
jgi:hypothetical protein